MATLFSAPQKRAAFDEKLFPSGLDRKRSDITRMKGVWRADSAASWRSGAPVMLASDNEIVLSDGTAILGVAAWPKMSLGKSLIVDVPVTLNSTTATSVLSPPATHGPISNVSVRSAAMEDAGTLYTLTTDYTVSAGNATVARAGAGAITDGQTVYVTYTFDLVESDYEFEGKNFWNSNDWVTIQDGRIAVVEAPADIFTTEYDTRRDYTLTGATSNIYVNSSGLFTSTSGSDKLVGYCINVPSAGDPYLGIKLIGQVVANT